MMQIFCFQNSKPFTTKLCGMQKILLHLRSIFVAPAKQSTTLWSLNLRNHIAHSKLWDFERSILSWTRIRKHLLAWCCLHGSKWSKCINFMMEVLMGWYRCSILGECVLWIPLFLLVPMFVVSTKNDIFEGLKICGRSIFLHKST